jgi:hypothetical protein
MESRFLSVVAIITLGALPTGRALAQTVPRPTRHHTNHGLQKVDVTPRPTGDFTGVVQKRPDSVQQPNFDVLGLLRIESFGLSRRPTPFTIRGVITSKSIRPIVASYKFSQWSGRVWVPFKTGTVRIPSKKTTSVMAIAASSTKSQWYKLDVTATNFRIRLSKTLKVAATKKNTYVVRYGTNGNTNPGNWVMAGVYFNVNAQQNAARLAKSLQAFGFITQRRSKNTLSLLSGQTFRVAVYIRTTQSLERTFPTREKAVAFYNALRKAVPSSDLMVERVQTR